jgi:hypothetical protein
MFHFQSSPLASLSPTFSSYVSHLFGSRLALSETTVSQLSAILPLQNVSTSPLSPSFTVAMKVNSVFSAVTESCGQPIAQGWLKVATDDVKEVAEE